MSAIVTSSLVTETISSSACEVAGGAAVCVTAASSVAAALVPESRPRSACGGSHPDEGQTYLAEVPVHLREVHVDQRAQGCKLLIGLTGKLAVHVV